jgi:hypothetical protein
MSSLPQQKPENYSDRDVRKFFNRYFTKTLSFPANQIDAVVGFFENRGFDNTAAVSTAIVLLEQAKLDDINAFKLLDTLKGLSEVELSRVVAQVLNYNRPRSSSLGFQRLLSQNTLESRNIETPASVASATLTQDYIEPGYVQSGYVDDI